MIRNSVSADVESIRRLIAATIESSYAGVCPPRAVQHFKEFHSADRILERQAAGDVLVAEQDGRLVATGSLVGAEISGVFVLPQLQRSGIGGQMMDRLEREAQLAGRDSIRLDVSLPSKGFYERRGYVRTGATEPFPEDDPRFGIPKVKGLRFVELAKPLL